MTIPPSSVEHPQDHDDNIIDKESEKLLIEHDETSDSQTVHELCLRTQNSVEPQPNHKSDQSDPLVRGGNTYISIENYTAYHKSQNRAQHLTQTVKEIDAKGSNMDFRINLNQPTNHDSPDNTIP